MMMIGYAGNIDPDAPGIGVLRVTLGIAPEKGDLTGSLFASFNQRNARCCCCCHQRSLPVSSFNHVIRAIFRSPLIRVMHVMNNSIDNYLHLQ